MSESLFCPICMDAAVDGVNFCGDKDHEQTCRECVNNLIESTINSSFPGACPTINCPSRVHQVNKKRRILVYEEWKKAVPNQLTNKYNSLANSLLAFLCGGCHALKSLDVGCDADRNSANYAFLTKYFTNPVGKGTFEEFQRDLSLYYSGEYGVENVYQKIVSLHFPHLLTITDSESWEIFTNILRIVADPERRANLHLRYLRDRPKIKTACCNREHCFKCKTKDFHDGKSCMENSSTLDHSVVCCPTCGISLAKGDGCNTVTCVCGKQFSWSAEKENTDRCLVFLQTYPENTSQVCAQLLCCHCLPSDLLQAKAWQIRHRIEVNRCLMGLFKVKYWPCPSQCCVVLPLEKLPEGIREAAELWKAEKRDEVEKCKKQLEIARCSLFLSLYPNESERAQAAYRLTKLSHKRITTTSWEADANLVASATKWVEMNREKFNKGVEEMEVRAAKQFLMLYGNCSIHSARPSAVSSPSSVEWDRTISNSDLTYTNDNTSVERVGSVSCYPAAFSALTSERSMFKVVVETAPKSSNWLTFGVARKGMANSSSDGIGRTSNTWGLSDDRSSSSSNAILAANGTEVGHFRKLRVGDELSAIIDTQEGWAEITVNDQELVHKFEIPPGTPADYYFAMTFANDHKVTIISDMLTAKSCGAPSATLNIDHTMMYHALKKQLKSLMVSEDFVSMGVVPDKPPSSLKVDGSEWVKLCTANGTKPDASYDRIQTEIASALNTKNVNNNNIDSTSSPRSSLTWNVLLKAVSWYYDNRDFYARSKQVELATMFYTIHGDDAPFMAAFNLNEHHTHNVGKDEAAASLAFMRVFSDMVNEWYAYDASSKEPMIDNVAPRCMCLPRHCKVCPLNK